MNIKESTFFYLGLRTSFNNPHFTAYHVVYIRIEVYMRYIDGVMF